MAKKRKAPGLKVKATEEEKEQKPKVEIKHEESEPEEDEQEVEESDSEEEESDSEEEESESEEEEEEEEEDEEEEEEVEEEEESESEEEEDEGSKKETLRKLLEPFSKEQIIDFLKEAALKDKSILSNITKTADSDPTHRKIFVHGLGWDATSDQVSSVFKHYGEIEECKVVTDKITGRAKGYGFVLFKSRTSARKALKEPQKKIGNRMTSSQLASAGPSPNGSSGSKNSNAVLPNPNPGSSANLGFQQQQQQGDFGNFNYMSPGFYSPMVGQTPGIGLVNPMMVSALSQNGIGATVTPQSLRISGSYGNINSVSPSVIGNYASQMALQGLGAYQSQNPQLGHSSVTSTGGGGGAGAAPTRQQHPGFGSFGANFPSYFGGR